MFGEMVKNARKEMGLSQTEVADVVGCSRYNILLIEKNQHLPRFDLGMSLVRLLNINTDALFESKESLVKSALANKESKNNNKINKLKDEISKVAQVGNG